jgi:hypothetical protein
MGRKIDFSKVTNNSVPAGVYTAEINKIEFNETKNYYNWEFIIMAADDPENQKYVGRKVWSCTSLKENAVWKLQEFLIGLGEPEEDVQEEEGFDFEEDKYIGQSCRINISQREYNGRMLSDVDTILTENQESQLDLFS